MDKGLFNSLITESNTLPPKDFYDEMKYKPTNETVLNKDQIQELKNFIQSELKEK